MRWKKKLSGFALTLDVAVAVLCIFLLLLAGVFGFQTYVKSAKINRAKSDVASLSLAVLRYAYDMENIYPDYAPAQCLPSTLDIMEKKDSTTGCGPWISGNAIKKSGNSYLDPWGNAYIYSHGSGDDGRFVVYSKGPDGTGSVNMEGISSGNGIGASGGYKR